jgi:hypothetical protein
MKYTDYLKTDDWDKKRKQVYKQAKYKCRLCNKGNVKLNAHHIYYGDLSRTSVSKDLICLCEECHKELHDKLDNSTLLSWASYRDNNQKATKKQYKKYLRKKFKHKRPLDDSPLGRAIVFIVGNFTENGEFNCPHEHDCLFECEHCSIKKDFFEITGFQD